MALFGSVQDTRSQMREKAITILRNYGERLFQNLNDPVRLFVNITNTHENVSVMIGSKNDNPIYGTCWDNQQDIIDMKTRLLQYCGCEHDPSIMEGVFVPYYNNLTF